MNDPTNTTLTEGAADPLPKPIPVPPTESEAQPKAVIPESGEEAAKPLLPPPPPGSLAAGNAPLNIPMLIAVGVLFVAVYATTFAKFLIPRWITDPAAQHGWLVIPIALGVTYMIREKLVRIPVKSHPGGLFVIGFALLLHLFEKAMDLNGPSPLSIPIFVAGAVWHFLGTQLLRELAFPIAYLTFMIPIPGGFTEVVSFPLRLLATSGSKAIAHFFGVDVYGAGMNLEFNQPRGYEHIMLEVADPCSGLHSLMAIKALHAITAYLTRLKIGWKWVLFMCAIPIALAANLTRISLIILIGAYWDKKFAETVFHEYSSPVLFVIAFAILISIGRFMEWRRARMPRTKPRKRKHRR
jgi:exosortase